MSEIMKCKNCGADTEFVVDASTEGFYCKKCDWSLVTTRIPKIAQDITKYSLFLLSADPDNVEHIKLLSEIANINYLQAKAMSQEKRPLIIKDGALGVEQARKALSELSIHYEIDPDFPYSH